MPTFIRILVFTLFGFVSHPSNAQECDDGYVYREAYGGDSTCVTPEVRAQAARDNAATEARYAPGAHGSNTCKPEYVWRAAFANDNVCVHTTSRAQAREENRLAPQRREIGNVSPTGSAPSICKQGFVWRVASTSDYVCVEPASRDRVYRENLAAASNKGSRSCLPGFVWREALPNDYVCVEPYERLQTQMDNLEAAKGSRHRPTICAKYAAEAVAQFNEMVGLGCNYNGDRWQNSLYNHNYWCLAAPAGNRRNQDEQRRSELKTCRDRAGVHTPPAEPCAVTVVVKSRACLNADGSGSSLAAGTYSASACAATKDRASLLAKLAFAQNVCITDGDTPARGCCTISEESYGQ